MSKSINSALSKRNYILIAASLLLVVVGFALMSGEPSTETFNPDIFSFRRIVVAPTLCFVGYVMMIVAILKR